MAAVKISVKCQECGKRWKTSSATPVCSKCNSSDIEPADVEGLRATLPKTVERLSQWEEALRAKAVVPGNLGAAVSAAAKSLVAASGDARARQVAIRAICEKGYAHETAAKTRDGARWVLALTTPLGRFYAAKGSDLDPARSAPRLLEVEDVPETPRDPVLAAGIDLAGIAARCAGLEL